MANTADVRTKLQIFLQKQASTYVISELFPVMPWMGFTFGFNGGKTGIRGLGVPSADGIIASKIPGAQARRQSMMSARQYMPVITTSVPVESDVKSMKDYDTEPVVSDPEDNAVLNRFTQPVFKFWRPKMPCSVWKSDVRTAKNGGNGVEAQAAGAIGGVFDAETKTRMGSLGSRMNKTFWQTAGNTSTGVPTDETQSQWDQYHSIKAVASATNIYAGVDRSLTGNSYWQGNTVDAQSMSFEDVINYVNYDLGFADIGMGVNLILVGRSGFKAAKKEAKTESYQLISDGKIPEYPEFGFIKEVVRISSGGRWVYVVFDPTCPSGEMAVMNTDTVTVAIASDGNFAVSKPADQSDVEGGREAFTFNIQAEVLVAFESPKHGLAYFTNFTF